MTALANPSSAKLLVNNESVNNRITETCKSPL